MKTVLSALVAFHVILSAPLLAQAKTWGPATEARSNFDKQAALDDIFARLSKAPNETLSRIIADEMWLVFMAAPDAETAELLNKALRARGGYNFEKALGFLDQIIEKHPEYAEGWNQRAFLHFIRERYEQSLSDCRRALELEPRHVGCMSGMARILIRHQKKYIEGEKLLRQAMELHPWIYERVLLKEIPKTNL